MTIEDELVRSIKLMRRSKLQLIDTLLEVGCPHQCGDQECPYYRRLRTIRKYYTEEVRLVPDNGV